MHPITSFSKIEGDKENIHSIPQGRSVSKLQEIVNIDPQTLKQKLDSQRVFFENNLKSDVLQDLDDPLESYLQYIKWIRENYTTGNTNESLLIQVLERTTHDFKDDPYYKNEVRYFKVWLEYITYSDHPGDVFNYLLKKNIGCDLSLFYENYSLFYELNDQWDNANSILQLGISKHARPYKRLLDTYEKFKIRKLEKESKSQNQIKIPLKGLSNPDGFGLSLNQNVNKKKKMQIFADRNPKSALFNDNDNDSFANLNSIDNFKKENIIEPSSWQGQTLNVANPKLETKSKLEIFSDDSQKYPITKTISHPNGKLDEVYDFNFDLFMPNSNNVLSMMEVLLLFQKKPFDTSNTEINKIDDSNKRFLSDSIYNTPVAKKLKTNEIDENNDDQLVESPGIQDTPLLEYFKNSKGLFSMNEDVPNNDKNDDDKNICFNETNKNILDLVPQETQQSIEALNCENENNLLNAIIGGQFSDIFTDTITKTLPPKTPPRDTNSKNESNDNLLSSPFVENPDDDVQIANNSINHENLINESIVQNPYDPKFKNIILQRFKNDIFQNSNFLNLVNNKMNKLGVLRNIFQPNLSPIYGNKQALLEFEKDELYCVTKELGRGKNSTVYLSEKMDGQSFAIKIESPSNIWEAYILSKLNKKSDDFVQLQYFYNYDDESYLIFPFYKQGTIMDMVNTLSKHHLLTNKNFIEETLIIYLTIELLNNVLKLHSLGLIHGNLKPEKCALNIQLLKNKLTFKDLIIVGFTKSIDLSLFPEKVRFSSIFDNDDTNKFKEFIRTVPWCYEIDYFGTANIIHTLLFNKPISFRESENGIVLVESIKKYWQTEIWNELFNLLLNSQKVNTSGNVSVELEKVKGKLESWFNLTVDKKMFLNKLKNISELLETRFKKAKS
jgi:checkpoint serine/threonine-protein kinase